MVRHLQTRSSQGFVVLIIVTMILTTMIGGAAIFAVVNHRTATGGAIDRLMDNQATSEDMTKLQQSSQDMERSGRILLGGGSFIGAGGPVPSPGTSVVPTELAKMGGGVLHRSMMSVISRAAMSEPHQDEDARMEWWQDEELAAEPAEWWEEVPNLAEAKEPEAPAAVPKPKTERRPPFAPPQVAVQPPVVPQPPAAQVVDITGSEWRVTVHWRIKPSPGPLADPTIDYQSDVYYRARVTAGKPGNQLEFYLLRLTPYRYGSGTIKDTRFAGSFDGKQFRINRITGQVSQDGKTIQGHTGRTDSGSGYPFDAVRIK